jgi:hypothetical protein
VGTLAQGRAREEKVEPEPILNVIAAAPLAAHKYASLEDMECRRADPSWVIPLSHHESVRANRLTGQDEIIDDIVA